MNTMKPKDQVRALCLIDSLLLRMAFKINWQALLNSWESLMIFYVHVIVMILPSKITFRFGP